MPDDHYTNATFETVRRMSHQSDTPRRSHRPVNVTIAHMQRVGGQSPAAQFRAHHESRLAFFHGPTLVVLHTFRLAARGPQRHNIAGQWPRGQFTRHHLSDKEEHHRTRCIRLKLMFVLATRPHGMSIIPYKMLNV